jgi:hypothetical protein
MNSKRFDFEYLAPAPRNRSHAPPGVLIATEGCRACDGTGRDIDNAKPCLKCNGRAFVIVTRPTQKGAAELAPAFLSFNI